MERHDLALAALLGPGLVVGVSTTLDATGVLAVDGLVQRLLAVGAVVLALGVLVLLGGLRQQQAVRSRPRRRDPVG